MGWCLDQVPRVSRARGMAVKLKPDAKLAATAPVLVVYLLLLWLVTMHFADAPSCSGCTVSHRPDTKPARTGVGLMTHACDGLRSVFLFWMEAVGKGTPSNYMLRSTKGPPIGYLEYEATDYAAGVPV
eukprot:3362087-Amphidinium_carterae.1